MVLNPLPLAGGAVFDAWSNVLNIANVILAIAFMVVIFAQATSSSLSSYSIKRMLPRIIAAAILMNLSYYICAFAIDLSNLAGSGVTTLLMTVSAVKVEGVPAGDSSDIGSLLTGVATVAYQGVATLGIIAVVLFFALVPTLLAVLAVVFVLAARQAIMILLVIIAPLAFALWVLPNTEKYFKKWWEWLIQMLVLYPMVMAVFAGATVASNIVSGSTAQLPDDPAYDKVEIGAFQGIIALIIMAMPLFALPALFKASGNVMGKLQGMTQGGLQKYGGNKANEGVTNFRKRQMSSLGGKMANNSIGTAPGSSTFRRRLGKGVSLAGGYKYQRDKKHADQDASIRIAQEEARSGRLLDPKSGYAQASAGIGGPEAVERVRASAIESVMRRGNERKENTEKMQSAFARLSPFAAQAFADSVDEETGTFDRTRLQQEIATRRASGQINENDVQELERVQNFGSVFTTAAMSGAAGSLARSGFLQRTHVEKAAQAIRAQADMSPAEKEVALDRLADNINSAAKESGMAQHMRWGVVGGQLIQNGQDIDLNGIDRMVQDGNAPQELAQAYTTYKTAERAGDTAAQTAALSTVMQQFERSYQTPLGFQKLGSAANISRKAFSDGGEQAFQFTMANNEGFREDVILTAAGAKGQMNAQDRQVLLEQAQRVVGPQNWETVVAQAKQKAGLFTGGQRRAAGPEAGAAASGGTPYDPNSPTDQPQQGDVPDGYDDGNDRS
jgi:hypothetical protein